MSSKGRNGSTSVPAASRRGAWCLAVLLSFGVILFLVTNVFAIRNIEIIGTQFRTRDEVLHQAKLKEGASIFLVNEKTLAKNIGRDPYLQLESLRVRLPDTVVLEIHESYPFAMLTWLGVLVLMDDQGRILENSSQLRSAWDLPEVSGLDVTQLHVGSPVVTRNSAQVDSMVELFAILERLQLTSLIKEVNLTDVSDIYLVTHENMKVTLGDMDDMEQKLGMYKVINARLTTQEKTKATLDITAGSTADYRPMPVVNTEYRLDNIRNPSSRLIPGNSAGDPE